MYSSNRESKIQNSHSGSASCFPGPKPTKVSYLQRSLWVSIIPGLYSTPCCPPEQCCCSSLSLLALLTFIVVKWVLQIMLYWLWGNVLCAGSMSFSALCTQARPAVLIAVIWVIMSGFGANLVLTQFIEQGPSVAATVLQIIPSMGLFRGKLSHVIVSMCLVVKPQCH